MNWTGDQDLVMVTWFPVNSYLLRSAFIDRAQWSWSSLNRQHVIKTWWWSLGFRWVVLFSDQLSASIDGELRCLLVLSVSWISLQICLDSCFFVNQRAARKLVPWSACVRQSAFIFSFIYWDWSFTDFLWSSMDMEWSLVWMDRNSEHVQNINECNIFEVESMERLRENNNILHNCFAFYEVHR